MRQKFFTTESTAMKLIIVLFLMTIAIAVSAKNKPEVKPADLTPEQVEASYTQSIEKRVADILTALDFKDLQKQGRVHDELIAQYRSLRAWHDANDPKPAAVKSATTAPTTSAAAFSSDARNQLKGLHQQFLDNLARDITPEQIEIVKDKMTYNKVQVTFNGYCEIIQNLTDIEKLHITQLLKEAREEAMDGGSSEEKSAIFKKYKGKIANYLSANGHDVAGDYKSWGERQKAKSQTPAINKTNTSAKE